MEEKSERLDLWAEKRVEVEVVVSGRKCRRARLTHTGLPKGHHCSVRPTRSVRRRVATFKRRSRQCELLLVRFVTTQELGRLAGVFFSPSIRDNGREVSRLPANRSEWSCSAHNELSKVVGDANDEKVVDNPRGCYSDSAHPHQPYHETTVCSGPRHLQAL